MVTIYGLIDPTEGEVRYVGKTNNLAKRLYMHIWHAKNNAPHRRDRWIRSVLAKGVDPVATVLETCEANEWPERERHWIAILPNLTNLTAGGEGFDMPRSVEWCERIGDAHRGKWISHDQRAKLRAANPNTYKTHCPYGHEYTEENTTYTLKGHRECKECRKRYNERARERRKKGV